ncbi:MAG TPA: hypothetical protein VKD72_14080 [Gemmataceae bacterium]|nr:hypothetical protein [Gemmataceae bacterium]
MAGLFKTLGNPELTPDFKRTIAGAVLKEVGSHSVEQLAKQVNKLLIRLIRLPS